MTVAQAEYATQTETAWREYQSAEAVAREGAIQAFEGAQQAQLAAGQAAENKHQAALARAARAWEAASAGDPVASSIDEAFRLRMTDVDRMIEAEKREILARMKADLERLTS